jgi:transposase
VPKPKPAYPPEFRMEAVRLVREGGRKISDVSRDLGASIESIRKWLKQAEIDTGEREGLSTEERAELQRLRREIRQLLREEREILKKAAVIDAQETNKIR